MYTSVKQYQILQPLSRKSSMSRRNSIMGSKRVIGIKRSVNSIIRKSGRESAVFSEDQQQVYKNIEPLLHPDVVIFLLLLLAWCNVDSP